MAVCSAVGLWLRRLPPWDTMLGGVGVVLALRFSAYGKARKSLLREARGLSPCLQLHIQTYMIHTCLRAWAFTVCCFFLHVQETLTPKANASCATDHIILQSIPTVRKRKQTNLRPYPYLYKAVQSR
jgi:hypothetical protein